MNNLLVWLVLEFISSCIGSNEKKSNSVQPVTQMAAFSGYWMAHINISYLDPKLNIRRSEKAELGRYSTSNIVYDTQGMAVLVITESSESQSERSLHLEVEDNYGCNGPFVKNYPIGEPWIAVIQRGKCTFNKKVANAMRLNASGVLIYDNENSAMLQSMKVETFKIPSVFTFQWKGKELIKLIQTYGKVFISLTKASHCKTAPLNKDGHYETNPTEPSNFTLESNSFTPPIGSNQQEQQIVLYCGTLDAWSEFYDNFKKQAHLWNWNISKSFKHETVIIEKTFSIMFVCVSVFVLALVAITWILFYFIRRYKKLIYQEKQTKQALAIIPTSILELEDIIKPDAHETCAVCIDQFKVGESVRSLPCKHQFHKCCIDLWLMEKPTCPMCKLDILKRYGLEKTSSGDEMV